MYTAASPPLTKLSPAGAQPGRAFLCAARAAVGEQRVPIRAMPSVRNGRIVMPYADVVVSQCAGQTVTFTFPVTNTSPM